MRPLQSPLRWSALLLATLAACDGDTPTGPEPDRRSEAPRAGDRLHGNDGISAAKGGAGSGQFTIILFMTEPSPLDVGFTVTGQRKEAKLDFDSDPTLPDRRTFTGGAGTYTVTMNPLPAGLRLLAMGCGGNSGGIANETWDISTQTITIPLEAGESVNCNFGVFVDVVHPNVFVNQAATQPDPTMGSSVQFTATFDLPVTGFTGSDVTILGSAGGTLTAAVTGGPSVYTITVSGITSDGFVGVTIPADAAFSAAGIGNSSSQDDDNVVERNTTRTVIVNQSPDQPDPATDELNIRFTVQLGEPGVIRTPNLLALDGPRGGFLNTFTCDAAGTTCVGTMVGIEGRVAELRFLPGDILSLSGKPFYGSTSTDNRVTVLRD